MIELSSDLVSPKIGAKRGTAVAQYRYYAGFSLDFVFQILEQASLQYNGLRVLDPWVGAGTTLQAAAALNVHGVGLDANPAMVVVSKARLVLRDPRTFGDFRRRVELAMHRQPYVEIQNDPLSKWLGDKTSAYLRGLQHAVCSVTGAETNLRIETINELPSMACVGLTALFNLSRKMLAERYTSNPTWFRTTAPLRRKGSRPKAIWRCFESELEKISSSALSVGSGPGLVLWGDSRSLALESSSFELVLSSPPYCTRIDYAIKTTAEIACLGAGVFDHMRLIRTSLIGTAAILRERIQPEASWGRTCIALLEQVRTHSSKASESYYYRTLTQYFSGLAESIREISRILTHDGSAVLVVQDSFYKELHIDLSQIVTDMAAHVGLNRRNMFDFTARQTLSYINSAGRAYRGRVVPTESVLVLHKNGVGRPIRL